jgi:flagella basal body P-ring formation protein FlgA
MPARPDGLARFRLAFAAAVLLWWCGAGAAAAGQPAGYTVIPVPAKMIYAGQPITRSALTTRRVSNRYLAVASVIVDAGSLDGKTARSTLVPGRPIATNQVREPNVIDASKPTRIIYRSGGLVIVGEAIPLSSAAVGDHIRARNSETGVVISGIAQADGSLLVAEQ